MIKRKQNIAEHKFDFVCKKNYCFINVIMVFFVLFCFGFFVVVVVVVVVVFQIFFFQKVKNVVTQYVTRCQSFVHIRNMKYLINL